MTVVKIRIPAREIRTVRVRTSPVRVVRQGVGPRGPAGAVGAAGAAGTNGTNGTNGADGVQGDQGPAGVATVNTFSVEEANLNDDTPAAPDANAQNIHWQNALGDPSRNVSAYFTRDQVVGLLQAGALDMGGQEITDASDPSAGTSLVTRQFMEAAIAAAIAQLKADIANGTMG